MYKWEDESWDTVNLSANYSFNDRVSARPYMIVPADVGTFSVYIEANGFMTVKTIGGKADGCWNGIIAYDASVSGWDVGNYKRCTISNFKTSMRFVCGHPDVELNGCKFSGNRGVECDWIASFELHCDDDEGGWVLYAPPIQKDSTFNYVVSYANYTDKTCEWGSVSISIDEENSKSDSLNVRRSKRGYELRSRERQPVNQTPPDYPGVPDLEGTKTLQIEEQQHDVISDVQSDRPLASSLEVFLNDSVAQAEYRERTQKGSPLRSIPETEEVAHAYRARLQPGDGKFIHDRLDRQRVKEISKVNLPSLISPTKDMGPAMQRYNNAMLLSKMTEKEQAKYMKIRGSYFGGGQKAADEYLRSLNLHERFSE